MRPSRHSPRRAPPLCRGPLAVAALIAACAPDDEGPPADEEPTFAAPTARPPLRGPGGPTRSFTEEELFQTCGYLAGSADDTFDHRNLVMPYRGHLVLPWAPEWGNGGLAFYDATDPCNMKMVGEGRDPLMRETHAIGFVHLPEEHPHAGDWAAVNMWQSTILDNSGIQFWDISDPTAPVAVANVQLDGVFYPDSYTRISLSLFWAYPYVYVAAADAGLFVVDATDPTAPGEVVHVPLDFRAGGVFAMGTTLLVTSAEETTAETFDISDPMNPQPIIGGRFQVVDRAGETREFYHANLTGPWALFARKESGGGPVVYDVSDPSDPTWVSDLPIGGASGGYIFYDEGHLFVGGSNVAHVIDVSDIGTPEIMGVGYLEGDLDTLTPYGNVAILAVDDGAVVDQAMAIMPWQTEPDTRPPEVLRVVPRDGATGVLPTSLIGVGFNEPIEPSSVFAGSIRLYDEAGDPVLGWGSGQEGIAHYAPAQPLRRGETYKLEVLADGITDLDGNAVAVTHTSFFTTAE